MQITFLRRFKELVTSVVTFIPKLQYNFSLTRWAAVRSVAHLPHNNCRGRSHFIFCLMAGYFLTKPEGEILLLNELPYAEPEMEGLLMRFTGRRVPMNWKQSRAMQRLSRMCLLCYHGLSIQNFDSRPSISWSNQPLIVIRFSFSNSVSL